MILKNNFPNLSPFYQQPKDNNLYIFKILIKNMIKTLDTQVPELQSLKDLAKGYTEIQNSDNSKIYMCDCDQWGGGEPPCDCDRGRYPN